MKNSNFLKFKGLMALLLLLFMGLSGWEVYKIYAPPPARAADGYEEMMTKLHPLGIPKADIVRCSDPRARLQCKNGVCTTSTDPQACLFYGGVLGPPPVFTPTVTATVTITPGPGPTPVATQVVMPTATPVVTVPTLGPKNLLYNGNFEFGFYQVAQLGFEIPDVGNVPNNWGWYRNPAYGKYNINNNQTLGLHCADDLTPETLNIIRQQQIANNEGFGPIPGFVPPPANNAASFQIQSSDQVDARLGIYQVVNVVAGRTYRLTMSGTIQIQEGAGTLQPTDPELPREAQNHTVELFFDYAGGTNWKAIPQEEKIILPWTESEVLFQEEEEEGGDNNGGSGGNGNGSGNGYGLSRGGGLMGSLLMRRPQAENGNDDEVELSKIEEFETLVTARTNKLTIFIGAWRKWANWRSGYITIDCVSLIPAGAAGGPQVAGGGQPAGAGVPGAGLPPTGSTLIPNYVITGQGLKESPRFGRIVR